MRTTARKTIDSISIISLLLPPLISLLDIHDIRQQQQHVEKQFLSLFLLSSLFRISYSLLLLLRSLLVRNLLESTTTTTQLTLLFSPLQQNDGHSDGRHPSPTAAWKQPEQKQQQQQPKEMQHLRQV